MRAYSLAAVMIAKLAGRALPRISKLKVESCVDNTQFVLTGSRELCYICCRLRYPRDTAP